MQENQMTKVLIGEARLSYVHVFTPDSIDGSEPKYSVSIIIPKSSVALIEQIKSGIKAAATIGLAKLGGKIPSNLKNPLRDGDIERPDDEAYTDSYFINASSKTKPQVVEIGQVNGKRTYIEITNEEKIYSGCYGYVSVNFFAFNQSGNKGIAAGLNNVLKTKDGEFLGGRASAQSDFESLLGTLVPETSSSVEDIF